MVSKRKVLQFRILESFNEGRFNSGWILIDDALLQFNIVFHHELMAASYLVYLLGSRHGLVNYQLRNLSLIRGQCGLLASRAGNFIVTPVDHESLL